MTKRHKTRKEAKIDDMLDFYEIRSHTYEKGDKKGITEVYPELKVGQHEDLMVRGKSFYAIWNDEKGLWSRNEYDVATLMDKELKEKGKEIKDHNPYTVIHILSPKDFSTNKWMDFQKYVKNVPDSKHQLDNKIEFANSEVSKKDYASRRLNYPLKESDISAYEELMDTLYSFDEKKKIEWSIGSVIFGDSKKIQKFIVFYGEGGTGKSTVLNIIQELFDGYWIPFNAKELTSSNNSFSMEMFKEDPLVAIQHDGDLSRIEDNSFLNSIVSHETMTVNEKFKSKYDMKFNCFLYIASNKPVKITDAKSGVIRRLIDVIPSGNKIPKERYLELMSQIKFELGGIAYHCLQTYKEMGANYYDSYIPTSMIEKTNAFYNFVEDSYVTFKENEIITLKSAWEMYKTYVDESNEKYPITKFKFKDELKNYFKIFKDRYRSNEGIQMRNVYLGFRKEKFYNGNQVEEPEYVGGIEFDSNISIFDKKYEKCKAQYANEDGKPKKKWDDVETTLQDLDTSKLHYILVPSNHIVIDFDLKGDDGEKSLEKNIEAAAKWPTTYSEISKSGNGIHLHYIYDGDTTLLDSLYSDNIEIKTFNGKSSLRRKLTKCNSNDISTLSSGLPVKGAKMVNFDSIKNEKAIRTLLTKNLKKEIHPGTKPSIDFIYKILDDAYKTGVEYDVTDMRQAILIFANNSTNQADYCVNLVSKMQFKSEDKDNTEEYNKDELVFFDTEVFPNLFVICWKYQGKGMEVVRMINPTSEEVEKLLNYKLVGFNNRRYDNHILYARLIGYSNERLYKLSQKIITGSKNCFFSQAYGLSYTDVLDFLSAGRKKGLKKLEIDLGIHHQENEYPWDEPIAEDKWDEIADYCSNDVLATEKVFDTYHDDFVARQILAANSGLTVNDTTNAHTTRIIFGSNKHPSLVYTDLSTIFPGYVFDNGKSYYRDEEVGEGGYVYSEPGMYENVALLDIASMHPNSIIQLNLFGKYTERFKELVDTRLDIKHKDYDAAKQMMGGTLVPYLNDESSAEALSTALKTAINSVYGLTSASFDNPFRDPRNIDNIVAKRGALFMINLKHEVKDMGYTVAHIKTDSIKIPNADDKIIQFVKDYGLKYGYTFELESTYKRMCLINDSTFIALVESGKHAGTWQAKAEQFKVPYVYKTLFTHEEITMKDMSETKSVKNASLYLDFNEDLSEDQHNYKFVGAVGLFSPVKSGKGGGILYRKANDKYYSVAGTKGFRWMETEIIKKLNKEDDIDRNYYDILVEKAKNTISKYGDFDWFTQGAPWDGK